MVIDTSAVLAILKNEAERDSFITAIADAPVVRMSAATYAEAGIVMQARYGKPGVHHLMLFITRANIMIEPLDTEQAEIAIKAYWSFGKGRHEAALNYGDCFSYALAVVREEKFLYKGDNFSKTDIEKESI